MDSNSSVIIPFAFAGIVFSLVTVLWVLVALGRVFAKFGEPAWKAWVPILNVATLLRVAGLNVAFIAIYLIPLVSLFSPVVTTLAAHQINLRFGKGTTHTVLALFLFPVWATLLGFGSAVAIGGRPALKTYSAASAAAPDAWEPRAMSSFAPPPPLVPPTDPWAPPISTLPPQVAISPPQDAVIPPAVVASAPPSDDDFDKTVVARRSAARWILQPEGGERIPLAKSAALLGRTPTSGIQFADAQVITLADPSKTVSKTHARLSLTGETWTVVDLKSTNGVFLLSDTGEETELEPGVPTEVGEAFRLGDLILRISRGK